MERYDTKPEGLWEINIVENDYGDWVKYGDIYPYMTAYKDILDNAMNLYVADPSNHRRPAEEYFKKEIDFLEGLK